MTEIRTVAVVGAGTIGASWTALFLAHGLDVIAYDPSPEAEAKLRAFARRALPDVFRQASAPRDGQLGFSTSLEDAVSSADFVQENAPEREDVKTALIARIEAAAPSHAIIASSTTAFPHSIIAAGAKDPSRVIIAHPFNPPHLVPLVELVGTRPDAPAVLKAFEFYKGLGREPVILKREAIGHLANRLQAALMREALYCLEQGIADVEDIDRAVRYGPGLRWAFMGPFQTYHVAGGPGGIRHYFAHLGPSQVQRWNSLGRPDLDESLEQKAIAGVEAMLGQSTVEELEAERDRSLKAIIAALGSARM
ncbi:MAG: 3-hydroxyacyl-CoA dehydrogenase [Hyphomicrobiaceae bacterium]|nr:3-hydroxyacyl-CoA dehydrogenase [Hyphomicrobiaceae bacterium]